MENYNKKNSIVLIGALITLLTLSVAFFVVNTSLKRQLGDQKIKSEKLLSEKLKLDKSIKELRIDMSALTGKNAKLDKLLTEANKKLQNKEAEIKRLVAENATVGELRAQVRELELLREQLNKDIAGLNLSITQLSDANASLNEFLARAKNENEILAIDNTILKAMVADNYRIEALRGKHEKLTINARKTDKLLVSFDLPSDVGKNLYFKVKTPQGDEFSSKNDLSAIINIVENNDGLLASASSDVIGSIGTKRVEMIYKPNKKLTKGVYRFNVYNENSYLGSTQLRLK
jgi:DNA repair exonuclease SbcCD ATPase subunit